MKKSFLLIASAALLAAGCANDDYVGHTGQTQEAGSISFNMQTSAQVRAEQASEDAATALGKMFIVWGEKNEANDGSEASAENLVFQNYKVTYDKDATKTTASNTNGWEYAGIAPYSKDVVSPAITATTQTIKYWDLSATNYIFTAVSAKEADLNATDPKVKITKKINGTTVYDKGYTIEVKEGASTGNIYYADRKVVTPPTSGTASVSPVTLTFRHFDSKIRLAMYETVPGYKVVVTAVKFNNTEHKADDTDKKFGVDGNFIVAGTNTKFTVSYESTGDNQNKAKVTVVGGSATATNKELGTKLLETTANAPLATTSDNPTYDNSGTYTAILPNPSNETDMKLTVSYDLISEDTGEKIHCNERTAVVPAAYCQWKSNYAYTYKFKISDKSAELYPITFDAVVVDDQVGNQENITTVSEPSITTFAVASGKIVTDKNEYQANNVIYASVVDQAATVTTTSKAVELTTTNVKLYTVTTSDAVNFPITEASVAQSLTSSAADTDKKIKTTSMTVGGTGDTDPVIVEKVPAEDGTERVLSALRWTGTANTTYAVEYINGDKKTYKIVKVQ